MCGICGIADLSAPRSLARQIEKMNRLAVHRGPDDEGMTLFGKGSVSDLSVGGTTLGVGTEDSGFTIGFGHRRLSIIDLSLAGHQPMSYARGRYWIVFNGEIYNYVELRQELTAKGYQFLSRTDTEVILASYACWGRDCLCRLNGMWAFAIYDMQKNRLFCARDRFGVKPFYYSLTKGRFVFSSEIKQLLVANTNTAVNYPLVADFLFWKYETHTSETFFQGIFSLPASHCLDLRMEDIATGTIMPVKYWEPSPQVFTDSETAVTAFREVLEDSVRLRLRSDVPTGVTLSGGLDSSSVTCLACQDLRRSGSIGEFSAFSVTFEDRGYSEKKYAELVAGHCGARPIFLTPTGDDLSKDWGRFVWTMEEPFCGLSYYSNWKIYEKIREQGVPVILNGQGGDELLLGYDRYRIANALFLWRERKYSQLYSEVLGARHHASMGYIRQFLYLLYFAVPPIRVYRRRTSVKPYLRRSFYKQFRDRIQHLYKETSSQNRIDLQLSEYYHYQLQHLLHHEDRVSMSFSIEARSPFLDYRLFELILGCKPDLLIHNGWSKFILREAMRGVLPEAIRTRTDKMGFDTPTARLLSDNREFFLDLLRRHSSDSVLRTEAIARDFTRNRVEEEFLSSVCSYLSWKEAFGLNN